MCPFCLATAAWIAAGAISTGGLSVLAITKCWNSKEPEAVSKSESRRKA